jgi:hypothetical protein
LRSARLIVEGGKAVVWSKCLVAALVDHCAIVDRPWFRRIHKDKIGEYSIRLSFGMGMSSIGLGTGGTGSKEEESWTRALRAVLAVLKRVLVIESEADREAVEG